MTRFCAKCAQTLSITDFGIAKNRRDGISCWCKACNRQSVQRYRNTAEGAKKHRQRETKRYADNPDPIKNRARAYYQSVDKEIRNQKSRAYTKSREICPVFAMWRRLQISEWGKKNRAKSLAKTNRRRAAMLHATPPWLTAIHLAQIQEMYDVSAMLERQTGRKYNVDHIVPLQGRTVRGLHVPWNLQVMHERENFSKGNKLVEA